MNIKFHKNGTVTDSNQQGEYLLYRADDSFAVFDTVTVYNQLATRGLKLTPTVTEKVWNYFGCVVLPPNARLIKTLPKGKLLSDLKPRFFPNMRIKTDRELFANVGGV